MWLLPPPSSLTPGCGQGEAPAWGGGGGEGGACTEAPASEGSTVRAWRTSLQWSQDATFCGFPLAGLPDCRAFSSAQSLISVLSITLPTPHTLASPPECLQPPPRASQALPTECVWRGGEEGGRCQRYWPVSSHFLPASLASNPLVRLREGPRAGSCR